MSQENMKELKFSITGMDCPSCAQKIEIFCQKIKGVKDAKVNFINSTLLLKFDVDLFIKEQFFLSTKKIGYTLFEIKNEINTLSTSELKKQFRKNKKFKSFPQEKKISEQNKTEIKISNFSKIVTFFSNHNWKTIGILSFIYIILLSLQFFTNKNWHFLFTILTLIPFFPIVKKAFYLGKSGQMFSVETLMSISSLGAIIIGASEEAAAVLILYLIGEKLESATLAKSNQELKTLLTILPDKVTRILANKEQEIINLSEVKVDDILEIKPGDRFPVDGKVISGESFVDESLITGEATPIFKSKTVLVSAGSINIDGYLVIQANTTAQNNTVSKLVKLISEAQASKTKTMRSIEQFSKFYTPAVLFFGILVACIPPLFFQESWLVWIYRGLAILLIGCPCALVISTPSAISTGILIAAKLGILIKNAVSLETIGKIKQIAFDKTGTLTYGKLDVTKIVTFDKPDTQILQIAASIEAKTNHPLAKGIIEYAKNLDISFLVVKNSKTIPGIGVQGEINELPVLICSPQYAKKLTPISLYFENEIIELQNNGNTVICIIVNFKLEGLIALKDKVKFEAKEAIKNLKKLNINSTILTGDNAATARLIADQLDIAVKAELLPSEKLNFIKSNSEKAFIAMVGDGINDAPALAAANIAIAMGNGSNIAIDSSQVIITGNKLTSIIDAISLSKKVMLTIKQNILIAVGLKVIFFTLTIFGSTQLWMAILADTGATLIVTLNSLSILLYKSKFSR
ncbi:cation-translocating P-type ATPase [Pigmentibacter sp. JX0631]|uniref:heavy metal translocating P-type ATPase n=1 Tax=Pigmentibacter sp. JX0631 TaxID=2976982 RepID=UPI0024692302|nr:cation-translocating P-type ATPase [Pigmentibacter sp. JX0631]WGL59120.1 cation-translocating P-type ATPase [Pigmentibacter sp. JX0631]